MAIVQATIQLAKVLDFRVVSEGVETLKQVEILKSLNCEVSQGYFYSPPLDSVYSVYINNKKPKAIAAI